MTIVWVIVAIVLIVGISYYNSFITKKNKIENARSDIEVQLKRRHDLIPNLIEIVQGYKKFEADTLTKITEARTSASHSHTLAHKAAAEDKLE
jgi:LemA protein